MDKYRFYMGNEFEAYNYLGAHCKDDTTAFRTFAPNAVNVSVIGDFSDLNELPMNKVYDGNFWELSVSGAKPDMMYKYHIFRKDGSFIDHCDPYAFRSEMRPGTASVIAELDGFTFSDKHWLAARQAGYDKPLNIYELHFGSWKKKGDEWYSYSELAAVLVSYLKTNGYNYVEIMPLAQYPDDESWGYQITGFFSPTSRYGKPDELKAFVNKCHKNDIGVILDFVPVHFAVNDYALWNYDGTALYEYPHTGIGISEWGSCNFMHSRGEVRSFLQSAAYYWLNEFHFDGLRYDAVSYLIYWQGDESRGVNTSAVDFLKNMNSGLKSRKPDIMLIAEDSSSYAGVTAPVSEGGLGFDYKWDMGWMNDTLDFFQSPPDERVKKYHKLTFGMMYFRNERYILSLSHDENVHGKATVMQKMNGQYDDKFPQARLLYLYMMTHPDKKLNFMGGEIGQLREWDGKREQDWELLGYPAHDAFQRYIEELNRIYLKNPALWDDYAKSGFEWIDCRSEEKCVYAFKRSNGKQTMVAVFNMSDKAVEYTLNVGECCRLQLVIDTDNEIFGGGTVSTTDKIAVKDSDVVLKLPAFSGKLYQVK